MNGRPIVGDQRPAVPTHGPAGGTASSSPLRVALVNDYEIIVRGLHAMLAPFDDRIAIVEHEVGGTPDVRADIALFDTFAGRRDAIGRAGEMVADGVVDHVVLYTWDAPAEFLDQARAVGVAGVVLKSVDGLELVRALGRIADGERLGLEHVTRSAGPEMSEPLSTREQEVLAMLALGYSNRDIARELFLSIDTIKTYVRRVFQKLDVNNRTQAALLAHEFGLAPPAGRMRRVRGDRDGAVG